MIKRLVFAPTDGSEGMLVLCKKFKNIEHMYTIIGKFGTMGWSLIEVWDKA